MVSSRKVLAYLLTFTLLALSLPTVNAAEETLVGQQATVKADEASLTVRMGDTKQYALPRSGLTLLPSVESKYASGSDLFNLYKSEGLYSYAPAGDTAELGRVRKFNGLEFGYPAASPRSMYPQDTTQAPQQQPAHQRAHHPSSRLGKALTIVGIGMMAGGGAMMAAGNDENCVGTCIDWRATGAVWLGAGAVLTVIGLVKLRH
ncbi:MAG: hypothetical protein ABSA70_09540 [Terriglobia bacterium]